MKFYELFLIQVMSADLVQLLNVRFAPLPEKPQKPVFLAIWAAFSINWCLVILNIIFFSFFVSSFVCAPCA
jgi:hypothetical protein